MFSNAFFNNTVENLPYEIKVDDNIILYSALFYSR